MATTKHEEVPVKSILLNVENYRHKVVASQEEALQELFADDIKRAQMLALATDIAQRGLDLSQLMILEPAGSQWRVLEGNRRIAAMKSLDNPDIIPSVPGLSDTALTAYRARFAKVGAVASLPHRVLCLVTDDRELAKHLIRLKHTNVTAHKGAGTVLWDGEASTRFELGLSGADGGKPTASNRQTAAAIALLDALRDEFADDQEMLDLIDAAGKGGHTTLGRLLIKAENQLRLGVQIEGQVVRFSVSHDALRAALRRVLTDLGTPSLNSRTTNTAGQVVDYLDTIDGDLPRSADRLATPQPPRPAGSASSPTKKATRRRQAPIMRKVFPGMNLAYASDKTRRVLDEMQKLRIDDHPYLLSAAMRMLIDLYTADVFVALSKKPVEKPSERARKCLYLLEPAGTKSRDRKHPRIHDAVATQTGDLSIDTMNGFMHRDTHNPTPDTIRTQVKYYQPFLEALDQHVDEQLNPPPATP